MITNKDLLDQGYYKFVDTKQNPPIAIEQMMFSNRIANNYYTQDHKLLNKKIYYTYQWEHMMNNNFNIMDYDSIMNNDYFYTDNTLYKLSFETKKLNESYRYFLFNYQINNYYIVKIEEEKQYQNIPFKYMLNNYKLLDIKNYEEMDHYLMNCDQLKSKY